MANSCGNHVELVSNPAARITRCACGTVHVHLQAQDLSLRIDTEALRHLANALTAATRLVDVAATPAATTDESLN